MYYLNALVFSLVIVIATTTCTDLSSDPLTKIEKQPKAPDFVLQDINDKQHSLSDYLGKVVVINFWASWCPPCIAEMPSLQMAADQLAKHDIQILGIGVGENHASVKRFLKSTPISFPLLLDTKSEVMGAWSVPSLPTTIVIDQQGRIALVAVGERDWTNSKLLQQIISIKSLP